MAEQLIELSVTGMHCANCAASVHKALEKKGLQNVNVNFASEEVKFSAADDTVVPDIVKTIENLGFKVIDEHKEHQERFYDKVENKFWFAAAFTLPLLMHMFLSWHLLHNNYVQLMLCLPVYILGCFYFGKSAFHSLKGGVPNMDVLIFVGSTAAFVYSLAGTLANLGPQYQFYETCATIITLVLLGNVFEKRSVKQTTSAVKDLVKIQETVANRVLRDKIETVSVSEIKSGDTLQVNEGERIPVDGDVLYGNASVDESMLTGESIPVEKQKYSSVFGGTIAFSGNFRMMATKTGGNTVLAQIIDLMKRAQAAKPPVQKLGDKVAAIFVPAVMLISLFTFGITYFIVQSGLQNALLHSIAVLVISCPCAMGLATPTAVMVGLGRAAKKGILIKGGDTIEAVADTKYIVFDKTGTLTNGKFHIKAIEVQQGWDIEQVRGIITAIEERSSHPIARSLVAELSNLPKQKVILSAVQEEKGVGMHATDIEGRKFTLKGLQQGTRVRQDDRFNIFLYQDELLVAGIAIEDTIKPEAGALINKLKQMGITPILLSGDSISKCTIVAQTLGISEVHAQKLPAEKLEIIENYRAKGKTIMIGDGINDAPALTKADVGISMSDASHVAIQSAKVVLLNTDLQSVVQFLLISRKTLTTIKQNLFWAFAYNIIAIPVAAAGFLSPMVGALAMAGSDVVVIGNSLRLRTKKIE